MLATAATVNVNWLFLYTITAKSTDHIGGQYHVQRRWVCSEAISVEQEKRDDQSHIGCTGVQYPKCCGMYVAFLSNKNSTQFLFRVMGLIDFQHENMRTK